MFNKKTVKDVELADKTVLLRTDYNVPINYTQEGQPIIMSDFRIRASLPTIDYLLSQGVKKIIIISHLGRPESVDSMADTSELERLPNGTRKYSLRPAFRRLKSLMAANWGDDLETFSANFPMNFHSAPIFSHTKYSTPIAQANDSYKIEMLENLRFSSGEKRNSENFAKALAQVSGADLFVQDGFGVVHRSHASTSAITKVLPSVSGLLLEKEINTIKNAFDNPKRPFLAILGGAKVGDKLPLIERFIDKADKILISGAMANTFLACNDSPIGKSKVELGQQDIIDEIYEKAKYKVGEQRLNDFIVLPTDFAVTRNFRPDASRNEVKATDIMADDVILDLGKNSIAEIEKSVAESGTIIWNGTVGYAEYINFAEGSERAALSMAQATSEGSTTIVGGGDTSALAISWQKTANPPNQFSLISTGGGAALELMSGVALPGVELLDDK